MMPFLEFTFRSGYHFFGMCVLIGTVGTAIAEIFRALRAKDKSDV